MAGNQPTRTNEVAVIPSEQMEGLTRSIARYRGTFDRLLPTSLGLDAETFVGAAASALWKNPKVAQAALKDRESLIVALRETARLGHMPGTKEMALAVRKGQVVAIEQYQGVKERMFRAGAVVSIHAEVVAKGEQVIRHDPYPPEHIVDDWFARNISVLNLVGVYAYAMLPSGACSRVVVLGRQEVMNHREKAEMYQIWDGPFGHAMWIKTAMHQLENWVPVSVEYARERARVQAVEGLDPWTRGVQSAGAGPDKPDLQMGDQTGGQPAQGQPERASGEIEGEVVP